MSTRSFIGRFNRDGTVTGHYCHSDGYYSWNGRLLNEHYQDPDKIGQLIALGDQSILAERIGVKVDFDWRLNLRDHRDFEKEWKALSETEKQEHLGTDGKPNRFVYEMSEIDKMPESSQCLFYHRDRGEAWEDVKPRTTELEDCDFQEFQYIYDPWLKVWFCSGGCDTEWRLLKEVMLELETEHDDGDYRPLKSRTFDLEGRIRQLKEGHTKATEVDRLAEELTAKEPEWA